MAWTSFEFDRGRWLAAAMAVLALGACDGAGGGGAPVDLSVGGSAAVGISSSSGPPTNMHGGGGMGGPPPGRTEAERAARKDYYRGPRGREF